jgi:hypothetical protein
VIIEVAKNSGKKILAKEGYVAPKLGSEKLINADCRGRRAK